MTMQRRHFELIAETIAEFPPHFALSREEMAKAFASRLASTNPNFNRERFLRACGVEG